MSAGLDVAGYRGLNAAGDVMLLPEFPSQGLSC